MTVNYEQVILWKYGVDIARQDSPVQLRQVDGVVIIDRWDLATPQPTVDDLNAISESVEYLAYELESYKKLAASDVNSEVNDEVIRRGILTDQLFFIANVADIGLLLMEWRLAGRPTELDFDTYYRAYREAEAYAATSDPTMTAYKMLTVWEAQWTWMRSQFADLNYHRRRAIEQIKTAATVEVVAAAVGGLGW